MLRILFRGKKWIGIWRQTEVLSLLDRAQRSSHLVSNKLIGFYLALPLIVGSEQRAYGRANVIMPLSHHLLNCLCRFSAFNVINQFFLVARLDPSGSWDRG